MDPTAIIELAPDERDGGAIKRLYEALWQKRREWCWLRLVLTSDSTDPGASHAGPRYRLTAQWLSGPQDPPQPGPRADLAQQIVQVQAFVAGWLAAQ